MKIGDIIYFAPGIRIDQVNFRDREQTISAFAARINEYYFRPAGILLTQPQEVNAFSVGILVITAMDAIAFYSIRQNNNTGEENRICQILLEINDFGPYDPRRNEIVSIFNSKFRNGLIHEGRIKSGHQFSFQYGSLFQEEGGFFIVDPSALFSRVTDYFNSYVDLLAINDDAYDQFILRLRRQFEGEIRSLRNLRQRQSY